MSGLRNRVGSFSFKDVNSVLLGVISLVVVSGVIAMVFAVGTLGILRDRYEMSGVFADSGGLRTGDVVRVAGLDVGAITGVDADFDRGLVVVTWEVDRDVDLGPDTTAEIQLATLLGGKYLRLDGPVEEPFMSDLPKEERRIPLSRTSAPTTIDDVLGGATRAVQDIDVDDVNTLVDDLAQLTIDNKDDIGGLITDIADVSAAVNDRSEQLAQLVENADTITSTLASKDQALAQIVDDAAVLLAELASRRDQLATLLGSGSETVMLLSDLIADNRAELDAILGDLHATLTTLEPRLDDINETLAFVGPTFDGFSTITRQGPWLEAVTYGVGPLDLVNLIELVLGL